MWRWLWLVCCGLLVLGWGGAAHADDDAEAAPARLVLERQADGLALTARLPLALPGGLQEALERGVPLHFVWQAEAVAPRWYWRDRRLSSASRTVRLAYQPLTRRWRVSVADGQEMGGSNALHRNVDTLAEALAVVTRVVNWPVASEAELAGHDDIRLSLRFGLALDLLPRPLQLGVGGPIDRGLQFEQVLPVPPLGERSP